MSTAHGLFHYERDFVISISAALDPPTPPSSKADQEQVVILQRHDFQVIWDVERAREMNRLRMLTARTHCDGALWPYQRAQWSEDGLARWALRSDIEFFESLMKAIHGRDEDVSVEDARAGVDQVVRVLSKRKVRLDDEALAALSTVARLGKPEQVLSFLEEMA